MADEISVEQSERVLNQMRLAGSNFEAVGKSLEETLDMRVPANRAERRKAGTFQRRTGGGLAVDFEDGARIELVANRRAIKRTSGARKKIR